MINCIRYRLLIGIVVIFIVIPYGQASNVWQNIKNLRTITVPSIQKIGSLVFQKGKAFIGDDIKTKVLLGSGLALLTYFAPIYYRRYYEGYYEPKKPEANLNDEVVITAHHLVARQILPESNVVAILPGSLGTIIEKTDRNHYVGEIIINEKRHLVDLQRDQFTLLEFQKLTPAQWRTMSCFKGLGKNKLPNGTLVKILQGKYSEYEGSIVDFKRDENTFRLSYEIKIRDSDEIIFLKRSEFTVRDEVD